MTEDPAKYRHLSSEDRELIAAKKMEIEGYAILCDQHKALEAYWARRFKNAQAELRALEDGLP